jgi:heterotetrameric sarcosine oxidase delta subunit
MLIPCPFCGPRDLGEFSVLGAARARPVVAVADLDGEAAAAAFAAHVYERENPAGPQAEHWFHGAGCQHWLTVVRDTRTHAILSVTSAGTDEAAQSLEAAQGAAPEAAP